MDIDNKALLKLGKKHQKWNESTSINLAAFKVNNSTFYLAHYVSKWSNTVKGYAIISPDSDDKSVALKALAPHVYYSITDNNLKDGAKYRAELDFTIHQNVKEYLGKALSSNSLDADMEVIYKRSYDIVDAMLELQNELVELWEEANKLNKVIVERGYFTEQEIEQLINYIPMFNLIQYKQFKPRYEYQNDFDVIYQNRKYLEQNNVAIEDEVLKEMTRGAAERQLRESIDVLEKNIETTNNSYEDFYDKSLKNYRSGLDIRVSKIKKLLRYP